ncbi:MAG: MBL fold metallo-hydrolase [Alphaproteobacteria bacterium]|nr:MAG: MBL fold metallo-hydrolase [Alphaproteobacteria bacterium]
MNARRITFAAAVLAMPLVSACDIQETMLKSAMASQASYFSTSETQSNRLTKISDRVYSYNWYFDRTLIVRTDEGLVIVDPFSPHLAAGLKAALAQAGIHDTVHTLIYSHYHLDHVLGGALLAPKHVIAHRKSPRYWRDFGARGAKVLAPTELIDGDVALHIGGVDIELLYLGHAHSDTQYAVYLPGEKVLYPPDTVSVKVFLPGGGPDLYMPGFLAALDRLATLDFETFVPSHFGVGTKADFVESVRMLHFVQDLAEQTFTAFDGPQPMFMDDDRMRAFFTAMYQPLKERYGDWHGFDQQALAAITRHFTGVYVGY